MNYAEQLRVFVEAATGSDAAPMLPLIAPTRHNHITPHTRLNVYRDGYEIRLSQATITDYPALGNLIGEEVLEEAVLAYVHATPSRFWDLNQYPIGFAAFFARHSTNQSAHALAQLESAITQVFWMADSAPLAAEALAKISPEALGDTHFTLRSALQLLRLDYAANRYLTAFRNDTPQASIAEDVEYLCLVRHPYHVQRVELDAAEYTLLSLLAQGKTFGEALDFLAETKDFNPETLVQSLQSYWQKWLQHGFFTAT